MRSRMWIVGGAFALALALAACGGAPSTEMDCSAVAADRSGELPAGVQAVLGAKCQACHQDPPAGGAKFPLLSYEDTQKPMGRTAKLRWQRMAEVIEPDGI